jgi:hypothetical protein
VEAERKEGTGFGFTVIATDMAVPMHWSKSGATWYVTTPGKRVFRTRGSLMVSLLPGETKPVTEPAGIHEAVQLKVAPTGFDVSRTSQGSPEQTAREGVVVETVGIGLTSAINGVLESLGQTETGPCATASA